LCYHADMNSAYPDPLSFLVQLTGLPPVFVMIGLIFSVSWTITWKGLGLWNAARDGQKWWFLIFLLINDLGILEISYLFWFRKQMREKTPSLFDHPSAPAPESPAPSV
jgi:hypothetical protein